MNEFHKLKYNCAFLFCFGGTHTCINECSECIFHTGTFLTHLLVRTYHRQKVAVEKPLYTMLLFSRSLEEYIRSVEKEQRSQHKHPKKGLLSIDMHDHVNKTTTQDQDGTLLNIGNKYLVTYHIKGKYVLHSGLN